MRLKTIPRHPSFFPDDTAAGWGLTMTLLPSPVVELVETGEGQGVRT
jgi:hypothetical protein